jgi:hypothetical protein
MGEIRQRRQEIFTMHISIPLTLASVFLSSASLLSPSLAATGHEGAATSCGHTRGCAVNDGAPLIRMAGKNTRDHRGAGGAPQGGVSVGQGKSKTRTVVQASGPLGGPKHKGGFGGLTGSGEKGHSGGATVRDHRKGK